MHFPCNYHAWLKWVGTSSGADKSSGDDSSEWCITLRNVAALFSSQLQHLADTLGSEVGLACTDAVQAYAHPYASRESGTGTRTAWRPVLSTFNGFVRRQLASSLLKPCLIIASACVWACR